MSVDSLHEKELGSKEYKQRKKIETVLSESERVKEQRRRAEDYLHSGMIDQQTANRMHRHAVMDLIVESRHLIQTSDEKVTVRIGAEQEEEEELTCYKYFWEMAHLGYLDLPEPYGRHQFNGLRSILPRHFADPLEIPISETSTDLVNGQTTEEYIIEYQVPWDVSWNAYIELRDFWGIHGLELEYDEGRPFNDWRDEYEDGIYRGESDLSV